MATVARRQSNAILRRWCAGLDGDVLSIGSGDDRDAEGSTYRQYFPRATSYTTSEAENTGASDMALDIRSCPEIADASYDVLFCSGVLEHVDDLHAALREMWRILRPGGVLLLGVPFRQSIHRAPQDFWRFTEHGVRFLLSQYVIEAVEAVDATDPLFPSAYWTRARKPGISARIFSEPRKVFVPPSPDDPEWATRVEFGASEPIPPDISDRTMPSAPASAASAPRAPLPVVCWLWQGGQYRAEHVNALMRMVGAHYRHPHVVTCVTDDPRGLDPSIRVVPIWEDYRHLPGPHGPNFPSCYVRLKAFSAEMADVLGERFVSMDLDCVITADLAPLWHRPEDFVIWKDTHPKARYNASMFLLTAGARRNVWESFDPIESPKRSLESGTCNGSDQGHISYVLSNEATWTERDGVYSWKNQIQRQPLPSNARIVFFQGKTKPWSEKAQRLKWVRESTPSFLYQVTA